MSGQGPSADEDGYIYLSCGNGSLGYNGNTGDSTNLGDSFVRLTANLSVCDWFTPYNYQILENKDLDLGSAGILLIPNTTIMVSGGKEGVVYVADRKKMGKLSNDSSDRQIIQSFLLNKVPNNIHGSPAYYDGPEGEYIYVWAEYDYLRAFKFNRDSGKFELPSASRSPMKAPNGMPGGMISVSSNGKEPGTGIVWTSHPFSGNANWETRPGILRAFDATDLTRELWNSRQDSSRDDLGNFAKFCYPTVANGKVYLATFSNQLIVYGSLGKIATDIAETVTEKNILLSPMPVSDYLNIEFERATGPAEITISDTQGRTMLRQMEIIQGKKMKLYLGNIPNGVYLLQIQTGEKLTVKRITVLK